MASSNSFEGAGSLLSEELDVLKAIYEDHIKILPSSSSLNGNYENNLQATITLEVKINETCFILFHVPGIIAEFSNDR